LLRFAGYYIIDSTLRKKYKGKVPKTLEKRVNAGQNSQPINPLRDGSEKSDGFPRGARETMLARYKRWQLGASAWNAQRKACGFFGHVTQQASGWRAGEANLCKPLTTFKAFRALLAF
jgi:hypothetical protein